MRRRLILQETRGFLRFFTSYFIDVDTFYLFLNWFSTRVSDDRKYVCARRIHAPRSSQSGERAWRKFSSTGEKAPGYRLSPTYSQNFKRMPAPDWAQKMLCIIVSNRRTVSPEFFSWVRTRLLLFYHTCPVRSPSLCEQGNLYFLVS